MKKTIYNVPAKGAAPLDVPATIVARGVEVVEDEAQEPVGLIYGLPDNGGVPMFTVLADKQPLELGNKVSNYKGDGQVLGLPVQKSRDGVLLRPADTLFSVTSDAVTPTVIIGTEWE